MLTAAPLEVDALTLGVRLGLNLLHHQPCMGYANGCPCDRCTDRAGRVLLLAGHPRAAAIAKQDSDKFFREAA